MSSPFPADCAARFEAQELLGQGGYGAVWRAVDRKLGRPAAVKLMHTQALGEVEQVNRFEREARITAAVQHPNVVTVLDAGDANGVPWVAYELLPGQNLRHALAAGPLDVRHALSAAHQVALGLAAAHAAGVLHRDVKPENVMAAGDGHYKVTDFGIARWGGGDAAVKTAAGVILGTPAYIAPEQIEGAEPSPLSDIYAIGVLLYELTTGQVPFKGANAIDVLTAALQQVPAPPSALVPEIPPAFDALVLKALAKAPANRYQSASELAVAIQATQASLGGFAAAAPAARAAGGGGSTQAVTRDATRASTRTAAVRPSRSVAAVTAAVAVPARDRRKQTAAAVFALVLVAALGARAVHRHALRRTLIATASPHTAPVGSPTNLSSGQPSPVARVDRAAFDRFLLNDRTLMIDARRAGSIRGRIDETSIPPDVAAELRGRISAITREAAAFAPLVFGNADRRLDIPLVTVCANLTIACRQLEGAEDPLIALFTSWMRDYPDRAIAAFPYAHLAHALRRHQVPGVSTETLARLIALWGKDRPPVGDYPLVESWVRFQSLLIKLIPASDLERAPERDPVPRRTAEMLLEVVNDAERPGAVLAASDLLVIYDHALFTEVHQLTKLRQDAEQSPGGLMSVEPQIKRAYERYRKRLPTARMPRIENSIAIYNALLIGLLATELETRDDRPAFIVPVELAARDDPAFAGRPFWSPLLASRRLVRSPGGLNHGVPVEPRLQELVKALALVPVDPKSAHRLQLLWIWSEAVLWAGEELQARHHPGPAQNAAHLCETVCRDEFAKPDHGELANAYRRVQLLLAAGAHAAPASPAQ